MKHLVLVIALAAFSTPAFAEGSYQDEDELRLIRAVTVVIEDQVKDGCQEGKTMNADALNNLRKVIDHYYAAEAEHFGRDPAEDHIFHVWMELKKYLKEHEADLV
jgi:hypothetical protein